MERGQGQTGTLGETRPLQRPGVSVYELDDDLVVYDVKSGQSYVLNSTGQFIWSLCDGTRTVDDLARLVADTYRIPVAQAAPDVSTLLDDLSGAGLLTPQ